MVAALSISVLCSAFQSLLSQASGSPSVPARLIRQSDVCKDPVLKSLCDSVQSALNMPYISKHHLLSVPSTSFCLLESMHAQDSLMSSASILDYLRALNNFTARMDVCFSTSLQQGCCLFCKELCMHPVEAW